MISGPSDNQSKFESIQFDGVSVLFPKIPDNEWTITAMDIVEGENVFYDRYGILDIEGWRYYNSKIDSQLFVTIAKIDNLKDPNDYFDFGLNLFSTLNEYGSPLIFDESAVKSIDADKCTAKKLSLEAGAIIFMVICHKENFLFQVTSSTTYKTDLTETYGIDFANQISEKIR